jgi:hypothetical protein
VREQVASFEASEGMVDWERLAEQDWKMGGEGQDLSMDRILVEGEVHQRMDLAVQQMVFWKPEILAVLAMMVSPVHRLSG